MTDQELLEALKPRERDLITWVITNHPQSVMEAIDICDALDGLYLPPHIRKLLNEYRKENWK